MKPSLFLLDDCTAVRSLKLLVAYVYGACSFRLNAAGEPIESEENAYRYEEDIQRMHVLFELYILYEQVGGHCFPLVRCLWTKFRIGAHHMFASRSRSATCYIFHRHRPHRCLLAADLACMESCWLSTRVNCGGMGWQIKKTKTMKDQFDLTYMRKMARNCGEAAKNLLSRCLDTLSFRTSPLLHQGGPRVNIHLNMRRGDLDTLYRMALAKAAAHTADGTSQVVLLLAIKRFVFGLQLAKIMVFANCQENEQGASGSLALISHSCLEAPCITHSLCT